MFSLRFDFRLAPHSPATMGELYATALDMLEYGEEHGATRVIISEHHCSDDGYLPSPLPFAGAVAARTSTLDINVGALLLLMYDPVKVAEDISVLDHLSGGRIGYTVALGYRDDEYAMFGIDRRTRGAELEERLGVLLRALRGEDFEWRGRAIAIRPGPRTEGGPMITLGGSTPAAARRAGRMGLLFVGDGTKPGIAEAYAEGAAEAGVPALGAIMPPNDSPYSVFVAEDVEEGWERYGSYMLHDARAYGGWMDAGGVRGATYSGAGSVDELRAENGNYRVVDPDGAVELIEANGELGLQPLCGGVPPEDAWRSVRLVVEEVLPRL